LAECLRGLSTEDIIGPFDNERAENVKRMKALGVFPLATNFTPALYPAMPWGPTIDGTANGLVDVPLRLIQTGTWNKVPVIMGNNQDEGSMFVPMMYEVVPDLDYPFEIDSFRKILFYFFPNYNTVESIVARYPASDYGDNLEDAACAALRDDFFVCPARRVARAISAQGGHLWLYHFTHLSDWADEEEMGVYHTAEIYFVFDNQFPPLVHDFDDADKAMADSMGVYWSNFGKTQNPNAGSTSQPQWPMYDVANSSNMILDVPPRVETRYTSALCDFWDSILYPPSSGL